MQFKKVKKAITEDGTSVTAEIQPVRATYHCYCPFCLSPLYLRTTHAEGRYFEHDIELSDVKKLESCPYLIPASQPATPKPPTAWEIGVQEASQKWSSDLGVLKLQRYLCVMCNHEYEGRRMCPLCEHILYSTEVENMSTETLSLRFAQ
ncbi:putative zinc ribbon protein [Yersinia intermedia]|uniref:putative zinc ribbon protein n=1 Tax=Yersinia intermedia TaxID=631 RepID=UPI00119FE9AF